MVLGQQGARWGRGGVAAAAAKVEGRCGAGYCHSIAQPKLSSPWSWAPCFTLTTNVIAGQSPIHIQMQSRPQPVYLKMRPDYYVYWYVVCATDRYRDCYRVTFQVMDKKKEHGRVTGAVAWPQGGFLAC